MASSQRHGELAIAAPRTVAAEAAKSPALRHVMETNPELQTGVPGSPVAPLAEKIVNGQYMPNQQSLDDDLISSANEDIADLRAMKADDEAKAAHSRTVLAAHSVKVQDTEAQRASRYFATHGMSKVGHLLGDELS